MDLEGTDGRERGEDDTAFENQSALFALAVSDIVLINMWCHDIGREQAANKPLLKTIFQVMMRLFSIALFDLSIKTVTKDPKRPESKDFIIPLHLVDLLGTDRVLFQLQDFHLALQQIWKVIKENRDLDLPAHKVMVATVRCEEIANENLAHMSADEKWVQLEEAVQHGIVPGFGKKLTAILNRCFSGFYFDETVRILKRQQLESKLLQLVHPHQIKLSHIQSKTLDNFKEVFDKSLEREELFAIAAFDCTQSLMLKFDKIYENFRLFEITYCIILFISKFNTLFSRDADSMPRVWTGKEDIKIIMKATCFVSLKLRSVMIAIHLDDKSYICIESASWLNKIKNLH
ncbi:unnamed protein product [Musa acuminata subsp. malaccensis]|uniref:(wild Malaysian banana) hypothetical protein n=1 Tax=Musa acuminata subsp. malaccensis TaxID=214687 RepID=A0A804JZS5_MUSAM|nr:unnamed protein product [Musa acuminata subsp. malaccensis]